MVADSENIWGLFNWLDIVLTVGLLSAFLVGLGAGLYRQLVLVFSLLAGLLLASQLTAPLAAASLWEPVHAELGQGGAEAAAYYGIILVTLAIGLLAVLIFRATLSKPVRFFDSVLGGATGTALGGLVFGLTILGVFHWNDTWLHGPIRDSYLGSRLAEGARVASRAFPDDFRERVEASLEKHLPETLAGGEEGAPAGEPR